MKLCVDTAKRKDRHQGLASGIVCVHSGQRHQDQRVIMYAHSEMLLYTSVVFLIQRRPLINWNKMLRAQIDSCLTFLLFRSDQSLTRLTQERSELPRSRAMYLRSLSRVKCVLFTAKTETRLSGKVVILARLGLQNALLMSRLGRFRRLYRQNQEAPNQRSIEDVEDKLARPSFLHLWTASFKLRY